MDYAEAQAAFFGRREGEVRALDWSGDVDAAIDALGRIYTGGYSMPAQDLPPEAP